MESFTFWAYIIHFFLKNVVWQMDWSSIQLFVSDLFCQTDTHSLLSICCSNNARSLNLYVNTCQSLKFFNKISCYDLNLWAVFTESDSLGTSPIKSEQNSNGKSVRNHVLLNLLQKKWRHFRVTGHMEIIWPIRNT